MKHNHASARSQWLMGGVMLTLAFAAGTTGFLLNVTHGYEVGLACAVIFGLGDLGKLLIPVYAGLYGWDRQLKATAWFCVVLSLACALSYYGDKYGTELLSKQNSGVIVAQTERTIAQLEAQLVIETKLYTDEASKKGCGPKCEDLKATAKETERKLDAARAERKTMKTVDVSGTGLLIASAAGLDKGQGEQSKSLFFAFLFLFAIEVFVWLSIPGMRRITAANAVAKARKPVPVKVDLSVEKSTKDQILAAVQAAYAAADELPSQRELARRFGISNSTFAGWMKKWQAQGLLSGKPAKLRVVA